MKGKMYKPFSDHRNIEKMVRVLDVFPEEETLKVTLFNWKGNPYRKNLGNWVKYVSTGSGNPREFFLYWDAKTEDEFLAGLVSDLLRNENYFAELENYLVSSYKNFKKFTDNLFGRGENFYTNLRAARLASLFKKFGYYHRYTLAGYYVAYDLSLLLPRLLKKDMKEHLPDIGAKHRDKLLHSFASCGIQSIVATEKLEFLKKLKTVQNILKKGGGWENEKIDDIIFSHWYKFGGNSFTHHNKNYSLEDYKKKFRKLTKLSVASELNKIKMSEKKDISTLRNCFKKYTTMKKLLKHVEWMRTIFKYRHCDAEYYHNYFSHARVLFEEIARRLSLKTFDDLWLLSKQEILDGILGKRSVHKIISDRKKKGVTIKQVGNKIKVLTGVKKEDWHERKVEKMENFSGFVAYRGRAEGKVRIIFNPQENGREFLENEILVAPMTTPDFVPLMKKCKAIITDEGGLLCHAAIVAREFKIPCIIGTKIATAVLKNGDMYD